MNLFLAPIRGITDYIYRDAFARYFGGADYALTPFINSVQGRRIKSAYLRDILPENNKNIKIIPQVLSKDPDDFIFLADRIFELGHSELNWNLGCPSPMIAKKQRGSGLLPYPDLVKSILDQVCHKYPDKISIKTRLGRTHAAELDILLPIFNDYPLSMIIIHPRLGKQMYKGSADHDAFARCTSVCTHRLVYNGDIDCLDQFKKLQVRFNHINDWMIGRGWLANPYLGRMIKGETGEIARKTYSDFHDDLFEHYSEILAGPSHLVGRMKGFWCYYAKIFKSDKKCLKKIAKARSLTHYEDAVKKIFNEEELLFL